jgi:hypothetical protein
LARRAPAVGRGIAKQQLLDVGEQPPSATGVDQLRVDHRADVEQIVFDAALDRP